MSLALKIPCSLALDFSGRERSFPSLGWSFPSPGRLFLGLDPVWQEGGRDGGGGSAWWARAKFTQLSHRLVLWSSVRAVLVIPCSFPWHCPGEDPAGHAGVSSAVCAGLGSQSVPGSLCDPRQPGLSAEFSSHSASPERPCQQIQRCWLLWVTLGTVRHCSDRGWVSWPLLTCFHLWVLCFAASLSAVLLEQNRSKLVMWFVLLDSNTDLFISPGVKTHALITLKLKF